MKRRGVVAFACTFAIVWAVSAQSNVIREVRRAIAAADLPQAERIARESLAQRDAGPDALEALSWVARGALAAGKLDLAEKVARETQRLAETALMQRRLDAEPHLPIALGAAFEVQAQVLAARGARSDAVYLLTRALDRYKDTSIHERTQKNIHLLSLVGQPAVPLDTPMFLGSERATLAALKGRPLLLFFWAHWCPDCKIQGPILAKLQEEFAGHKLQVVAPTQQYGYAADPRQAATPEEERAHIAAMRQRFYPSLADVPMPLSQQNFKNYGISSTPTLVLVDREGLVRLYHPGRMTEGALREAIRDLVAPAAAIQH